MHETFIRVTPGNIGYEAQSCAVLITEMFRKRFRKRDYKVTDDNDSTGYSVKIISDVPLLPELRSEIGVHKVTRADPHDALKRRTTSFVYVSVIAWGEYVRSYVLDPYEKAKNHITQEETENVEAVLNGSYVL